MLVLAMVAACAVPTMDARVNESVSKWFGSSDLRGPRVYNVCHPRWTRLSHVPAPVLDGSSGRIAVCAVGATRTLADPAAYGTLKHNVIDHNGADLFLHLMHGEQVSIRGGNYVASREQMSAALSYLRPVATRVQTVENAPCEFNVSRIKPGNDMYTSDRVLGMLGLLFKYESCARMVLHHEKVAGIRYDFLVKTRPDIVYCEPVDFRQEIRRQALAMRSAEDRWIVGGPDLFLATRGVLVDLAEVAHNQLVHRARRPQSQIPKWQNGKHANCWQSSYQPLLTAGHLPCQGHRSWVHK
ncbi:hypothetical protein T492DRAFT_305550 [Pavlovales sp. CCMP2436]|nr:hypothetical protein T492DRAFT_305550 [Pavlovales sp. CCMP2436]